MYRVGDVVLVRSDLEDGTYYPNANGDHMNFVGSMQQYRGKFVQIVGKTSGEGFYKIRGSSCLWSDGMFVEFSDAAESRCEIPETSLMEVLHGAVC